MEVEDGNEIFDAGPCCLSEEFRPWHASPVRAPIEPRLTPRVWTVRSAPTTTPAPAMNLRQRREANSFDARGQDRMLFYTASVFYRASTLPTARLGDPSVRYRPRSNGSLYAEW